MVAERMAHDRIGRNEVDLVCSAHSAGEPALDRQVLARSPARPVRWLRPLILLPLVLPPVVIVMAEA